MCKQWGRVGRVQARSLKFLRKRTKILNPRRILLLHVNGQKHISNQAYSIYVMFVFPRNEHTLLAYEFFY